MIASLSYVTYVSAFYSRAFDYCKEPLLESLAKVKQVGCDRLLTSGREKDVVAGKAFIARFSVSVVLNFCIYRISVIRKQWMNVQLLNYVTSSSCANG